MGLLIKNMIIFLSTLNITYIFAVSGIGNIFKNFPKVIIVARFL